jgi:hypothetical protein
MSLDRAHVLWNEGGEGAAPCRTRHAAEHVHERTVLEVENDAPVGASAPRIPVERRASIRVDEANLERSRRKGLVRRIVDLGQRLRRHDHAALAADRTEQRQLHPQRSMSLRISCHGQAMQASS